MERRAVFFVFFQVFYTIGELYACVGMLLYMPDLASPMHWRMVSNWSSIPAFVFLSMSIVWMHETAHWLMVMGRVAEARAVLQHMAEMNGRGDVIEHLGPPLDDTCEAVALGYI